MKPQRMLPRLGAWMVPLLLLTAVFSGCLAAEDGPSEDPGSDDGNEDRETGLVFEPEEAESPVRLELFEPEDPTNASQGVQDVRFRLYDSDTDEPITDAEARLAATMPAMGHGTTDEVDPTHEGDGIYVGQTNFMMPGAWLLTIDVRLAEGDVLTFKLDHQIGGGASDDDGDDHDGHDGHDGHEDNMTHEDDSGHGHDGDAAYASFDEAWAAEGTVYEPTDANSTVRLKLFKPDPHHVHEGETPVTFLLYDADEETPYTDAHMTLEAYMPAMGHGTTGEEDPTHAGHGVYEGKTNLFMAGNWTLNVDGHLPDVGMVAFDIPLEVAPAHGDDHGDEHSNELESHGAIFNSGDLQPGESFNWTVAEAYVGKTIPYHCHYHAFPNGGGMVGNITVSEDAELSGTVTVGMSNMAFWPENLHVQPGTVIVWENNNSLVHTVTSGLSMSHDHGGDHHDDGHHDDGHDAEAHGEDDGHGH